jgi:hypothetical protein
VDVVEGTAIHGRTKPFLLEMAHAAEKDELDKMKQWLTKRLKVNNISLFRKQDD